MQAVFLYFIINVLWVVATFFLQAIGGDVLSIEIPKYFPNNTLAPDPMRVEPLSLMFLLSFAILLIVQFLAMLYHRYDSSPSATPTPEQSVQHYMELDYLSSPLQGVHPHPRGVVQRHGEKLQGKG